MNTASDPQRLVKKNKTLSLRTFALYPILISLLYFALRKAPLEDIWAAVNHLKLWQILILVFINLTMYLLVTLRWWVIARGGNKTIPYFPLVLVRIAVFGISYFTLGPQVGGEPLQVFYLQRKYGMSYTRATSTVILDKLLEFLGNFFLLVIGLTAIFQAGILSTNGTRPLVSLIVVATLLLWPFIHIGLMMRSVYPIGAVLHAVFSRSRAPKWIRFIIVSERMAGLFCQRNTRALWVAAGASVIAAAGMIGEYSLITAFLGVHLHSWQTVAGWATNWLSFLVPLPGGLGALEASQVFTLGAFEVPAALALSVALLIRARDTLIGGLGLLLASRGVK